MTDFATTKMSSRGQVVIPENIRERLGLRPGDQFVVVADGDAVILKTIAPPSAEDFEALLSEARRQARRAGMQRSDIKRAIRDVRRTE